MSKSAKVLLAGLLVISASVPAFAHKWDSGDTAALVGGALLGGITAAAISNEHRHEYQYLPPPPAYVPPKAPFSPAAGVICYPSEWACYNNNGHFNASWTNRIF